ncbi:MAG: CBS domain-containing protein [Methanosarcina thermophila]|jgi:CBS domain-containing protein|uniref:CBS domain protein n=3 Tax=Methanosarcina thermophila TaxID=2210 RepID=A0A1I6ZGR5_METTE|nr:CBS domain-containing protein [Methanosarcina thermophila]ALK04856.1 MAG: signal-transduction protein containing cAMP-binding and CBS domains [Methanosarcina sp. 795]AKB13570.1 Inosine-5'-monophosphate dehydrogenase [Methanosarcina thermophila TM-1]AKB15792.1 Inosine-5'-monophosphate dehydrogenase [Methanosarcina thermophila CHTI-55]NLU56731.1 CBS domain-containing protein [Methanosarcina thermophila]SFT61785.1 CBS-domain-containing membrane protein [Methanosarcina thermophila]
MNVADIMSSPVYVINADEPVSHARKLMLRHKISTLLVLNEGKMVGIVTKSDIANRLAQAEPLWRRRPIDQVPIKLLMTESVITIYPEASISQAAALMLENRVHNIPVVKNDIVGIVTRTDLVRYVAENEEEIKTKIPKLMTEDIVSVHRHHTINHVIDEMNRNEIERVIVKDDAGKPVGIISRKDLALNLLTDFQGELSTKNIKMTRKSSPGGQKTYRYVKEVPLTAEDIMVSPIVSIDVNETVSNAAKKMIEEGLTALPVSDGEDIVGILSRTDIMKAVL